MSARKKRPVMYEVIGRGRRARSRPSAWRSAPPRMPASPPPAAEASPAPPPAVPPPVATPPGRTESWTPAAARSDRQRSFRYSDGQLYLVLPWTYLAIVGVLAIAVLIGVYGAGRRSALPPQPQTLEQAGLAGREPVETPVETSAPPVDPRHRRTPDEIRTPRTSSGDSGTRGPTTPTPVERTPPAEPAPVFEPGRWYVLVQYFRKSDPDHARAAAEFLRANGVSCAVVEAPRDLQLYVTQPFDSERATRDMQARVKALGREYAKQGGGYSFAEPQAHRK